MPLPPSWIHLIPVWFDMTWLSSLMSSRAFLDPFSFQKALTPTVLFSSTTVCSQSTLKGSLHCDIKSYGSIIFPGGSVVKSPPANAGDAGDVGSIPWSGRSPGGGHGNPLQYSCLENPVDREAWTATIHRITNNQTWLREHLPLAIPSLDHTFWMAMIQ